MGRLAKGSVWVRVWAEGGVAWAQVRGQGAGARAFSFRASLGADVGRGVSGLLGRRAGERGRCSGTRVGAFLLACARSLRTGVDSGEGLGDRCKRGS